VKSSEHKGAKKAPGTCRSDIDGSYGPVVVVYDDDVDPWTMEFTNRPCSRPVNVPELRRWTRQKLRQRSPGERVYVSCEPRGMLLRAHLEPWLCTMCEIKGGAANRHLLVEPVLNVESVSCILVDDRKCFCVVIAKKRRRCCEISVPRKIGLARRNGEGLLSATRAPVDE
jgi:hypothetical protein